jgi:hypothetical protein
MLRAKLLRLKYPQSINILTARIDYASISCTGNRKADIPILGIFIAIWRHIPINTDLWLDGNIIPVHIWVYVLETGYSIVWYCEFIISHVDTLVKPDYNSAVSH